MPPSAVQAPRPRPGWVFPVLFLLAAAIFVLPFFLPVHPAFAESYLFGFNTRASLLLSLALLTAIALLGWFGHLRFLSLSSTLPPSTSPALRGATLAFTLIAATLVSIGFFLLLRSSHGAGESIYFLDRIGLLAQGLRPYRDFEFVYGPLQLYAPLLASRSLHLSLSDGYFLVWLLSTLLGLTALWLSVRWIDLPMRGKRATFLLLAIILGSEILSAGLNYNPLRYAAPIAALLFVERLSREASSNLRPLVACVLCSSLLLGLSPEIGLTFSIAILLFLPLRRIADRLPWVTFTLSLAASLAAVLLLANQLQIFATMKAFSAGSFSLPLLPGPHILLFFIAFAIVLLYLAVPSHPERLRSNVALLTLYSFGMLPAALGRCDWAHIVGYELGIVLCSLLLLATFPHARWISQSIFACVFFLMFLQGALGTVGMIVKVQLYTVLAHGDPTSGLGLRLLERTERSMLRSFGPVEAAHKLARIRAVALLPTADPHILFPGASPILYAPFTYSPQRLGNWQSPALVEGRYMGALNIFSPAQVNQKIAEMQAHPERDLLLSDDGLDQCAPFTGSSAVLHSLFLLPIAPAPRHQFALNPPICQYIRNHYRILIPASAQTGDYALWRHQPTTP